MHTGQTIEVPFDVMVLFSTNLSPHDIADEAFLRRIRYKIDVPDPSESEFRRIFRIECEARDIAYEDAAVTHLLDAWYTRQERELRGCHPRDVVEAIVDTCSYERREPSLSRDLLDEVCATYFL
jgi:SpoVK/Ycf46/Vps4 family AAA+-type ATPase